MDTDLKCRWAAQRGRFGQNLCVRVFLGEELEPGILGSLTNLSGSLSQTSLSEDVKRED